MHLDEPTAERLCMTYKKKMHILYSMDPNAPCTTAGIAFIVNKSLIAPKNIKSYKLCAGRALAIKIAWLESESTTLVNAYAPNKHTAHLAFWEGIKREGTTQSLPKPKFTLGNLNVMEDPIDRAPTRPDNPNTMIEALRNLHFSWEIQDAWRQNYPTKREYTYRAQVNSDQIKS